MSFVIFFLQFIELITIVAMWGANEYPEDVLAPFLYLTFVFIFFLFSISSQRHFKKPVSLLAIISSITLLTQLILVIFRGYNYYDSHWRYLTESGYRWLIASLFTLMFFEIIKIYLLNKNRVAK